MSIYSNPAKYYVSILFSAAFYLPNMQEQWIKANEFLEATSKFKDIYFCIGYFRSFIKLQEVIGLVDEETVDRLVEPSIDRLRAIPQEIGLGSGEDVQWSLMESVFNKLVEDYSMYDEDPDCWYEIAIDPIQDAWISCPKLVAYFVRKLIQNGYEVDKILEEVEVCKAQEMCESQQSVYKEIRVCVNESGFNKLVQIYSNYDENPDEWNGMARTAVTEAWEETPWLVVQFANKLKNAGYEIDSVVTAVNAFAGDVMDENHRQAYDAIMVSVLPVGN